LRVVVYSGSGGSAVSGSGWEVFGEPELQADGETWTLVSFMSEEDEYRYIELLPGSNFFQVWDEESGAVGEPTWNAEEVEEALFS
jgi:hypothetical protein